MQLCITACVLQERGIIIRVRENGIVVLVPRFGIESMIFLAEPGDVGTTQFDDNTLTVTCKGVAYRIFEWLDLEISVDKSQPHRPALALKILGPVEASEAPVSKRARKK